MSGNQLTTFAVLPDEIIQHIFTLLSDDVACIRVGSLVSHSLRHFLLPQLFSDIWCGAPSQRVRSVQTWLSRLRSSPLVSSCIAQITVMAPLFEPPERLGELIQLCTRQKELRSLTLVGVHLELLATTARHDRIFGHTLAIVLRDVVIHPNAFLVLINSAKHITSFELDPDCSCEAFNDHSFDATIPLFPSGPQNVTDVVISLTDTAPRSALFNLVHRLQQNARWSIQSASFDVGADSSASLASMVSGLASTVGRLRLSLPNCPSPQQIFSQFNGLTALTQLSITVNEPMLSDLADALLSLPRPGELTALRLTISLHSQLCRADWIRLGLCITSRHWVSIMNLQSVFLILPTPTDMLRWQTESFLMRRLLNEGTSASDPDLEVQPVMFFERQMPYYPDRLVEHNESSTQQLSGMIQRDPSVCKLQCIVISTVGLRPTLAYTVVPNFNATTMTLERCDLKLYIQDAYLTQSQSNSSSPLQYIYQIPLSDSSSLYVAICPIQEFRSLNIKNDIATAYLRSASTWSDESFQSWTGNVVVFKAHGGVLQDATDLDFPIIDAELPRFVRSPHHG